MKKTKYLALALVTIFAFPSVYGLPSVFQQDNQQNNPSLSQPCGTTEFDCYQESDFRLTSNPVICMNSPPDPTLSTKVDGYAVGAVEEWSNLLNGGSARHPLWNIQLVPTGFSDACNITIDFLDKPTPDVTGQAEDAVGVTTWYFDTHTAKIHIYYDSVGFNNDGTVSYSNYTAPDYQIQWAIRHELGHAFGLSHYILSDAENNQWYAGTFTAPSIMIPDMGYEIYKSAITQMDIAKLKSLYNNNGFGTPASSPVNATIPSIPTPDMSPSDINYWSPIIRDYFNNSTNNLASSDYGVNVLNLVDVLDSEHLTSIPDPVGNQTGVPFRMYMPAWLANVISFWSNGLISDNDLASAMQYLYDNGLFYFKA